MEQYVIRQQKKLRRGFTTGTCAAAAAKGAAWELLTGLKIREVTVRLPSGERPKLSVYPADPFGSQKTHTAERQESAGAEYYGMEKAAAEYYCIKDAGDDPDVTDRAEIHVRVQRISPLEIPAEAFRDPAYPRLVLTGGSGVGTVTKPGLEQQVGQSAINQVPRHMIFDSVQEVLNREENPWRDTPENPDTAERLRKAEEETAAGRLTADTAEKRKKGIPAENPGKEPDRKSLILITVSVPDGERIAQKTFNPKLGILGGISILGTSGIVEPMSEAALVAAIEVEVRQTVRQGQRSLIFVPGNYGEKYVRRELGLTDVHTVQCSNYVGEAIDLAIAYQAERILFVGNFGKLIKLAAGIMNTHSRYADGRWEIIVSHAALQGEPLSVLQQIHESVTTDQMLTALKTKERRQKVVRSILTEIDMHLKRRAGDVPIGAMIYSEKYGFVGKTEEAEEILYAVRTHR